MKKRPLKKPILQTNAFFWDGTKQLLGTLELRSSQLIFRFDDFQSSHLNLSIELIDIEYVKVFLIFNLAKNGLKVQSLDGKVDLFVMEGCEEFCRAVNLTKHKYHSGS